MKVEFKRTRSGSPQLIISAENNSERLHLDEYAGFIAKNGRRHQHWMHGSTYRMGLGGATDINIGFIEKRPLGLMARLKVLFTGIW